MQPMQPQLRAQLPISSEDLHLLLRSSNALSTNLLFDIPTFIHDAERDIQTYDRYIDQIRVKQTELRADIARCSSLASPIRRLPSELLQRIFVFALEPLSFNSPTVSNIFGCETNEELGPTTWESVAFCLASVCHRWREVAVATPAIWSRFAFYECERALDPVRLCILRSSSHEISFIASRFDETVPELIETLIQHSRRWSHFTVYGNDDFILAEEKFPALTSAGFPFTDGPSPAVALVPSSLNSVTIGVNADQTDPDLQEHMDTARHLTIEHSTSNCISRTLNLLSSCSTSLNTLAIRGELDMEGWTGSTEHQPIDVVASVSLQNVTFLFIDLWTEGGVYPHLEDLFRSLTLPSIRHLLFWGECAFSRQAGLQWRVAP
ncbi:hypothetical protein AAF712_009028 [Marasmius tenuissimus]|uniref:F-box domain-containing protein n=1 Tax=Marasmius tenuissimus TaxID=585030 RepID=A0ABR2ZUS4_9AGAR